MKMPKENDVKIPTEDQMAKEITNQRRAAFILDLLLSNTSPSAVQTPASGCLAARLSSAV